jgi:hypothetical protein
MNGDLIIGRYARGEATFQRQQSPQMASLKWSDAERWTMWQLRRIPLWFAGVVLVLTLIGAWR